VRRGVETFHALVMWRMRLAFPPLNVTAFPPSIVVSFDTGTSEVTVIVAGADPQSNVTMPPAATAALKACSVQLAADPSPTTVVGLDTSTGLAAGLQTAPGVAGAAPS
jgi:hypothetical protein